jgi:hypothetical protein
MAMTYIKTGRFRMCPMAFQIGPPEFQTVEGHQIPPDQAPILSIFIFGRKAFGQKNFP